jgi:hypothetical protein
MRWISGWMHDVSEEIAELDLSPQSLRKFGLTVGIVFGLLAGWFFYRDHAPVLRVVFACVGGALIVLAAVLPRALRPVYQAWMGFAFAMGWIMSRVLLAGVFFLMVTPISLLGRVFGKQFLDVKFRDGRETFWMKRDKPAANYERMY